MYSQNNEDEIINGYFGGAVGHLLDIGAYDGVTFSNSRRFLLDGWSGVLVEPIPECCMKIRSLYPSKEDCERIRIIENAIGPSNQKITFYESDMYSTIPASYEIHKKKWYNKIFKPIQVEQIDTLTLFGLVGIEFDFITLDVENYNIEIVRQLPEEVLINTQLFCIEHDNHHEEIESIAKNYGFKKIGFNGENIILGK